MSEKTWWGFPRQIANIVGNEACERFSYYGMRAILVVFMVQHLRFEEHMAVSTYHFFMTAVYFLPLFGGYLSDRYLGKYNTILYLSLVYCAGHAVLAMYETRTGLYWGLGLIALGAGGIKPCVSSFVGDQFHSGNKHLISRVYDLFYFSVNFGAVFSSLLTPWLLVRYGSGWAFGIPGVLMAVATLIFWMGRKHYVNVPPASDDKDQSHFFAVVSYALKNRAKRRSGQSWLDVAQTKFGSERVDGVKSTFAVLSVFASVTAFWALYDQTGSSWVLQAQKMNLLVAGIKFEASQIQALNPVFVMILIPIISLGLYPWVEKMGVKVSSLRKMGMGMFLTGLSFVVVGGIEVVLNSGVQMSVAWQLIPFLLISAGEVMVSITGLEFAYTQAPKSMKSTIMSFWFLTIAAGNFLTAVISAMNPFSGGAPEFFFYGGLIFLLTVTFALIATKYKERSFLVD